MEETQGLLCSKIILLIQISVLKLCGGLLGLRSIVSMSALVP